MPRYFFHFRNGGLSPDEIGTELADDAAVQLEAMRTLPAIALEEVPTGGETQEFVTLVVDEAGAPVYTATLTYKGTWLRT